MQFLRHRIASRRLVGMALLALLLGHWTVLTHSIVHARAPAAAALVADADPAWGHLAGTAACHLVDHLLAGQAPAAEPAPPAGAPAVAGPVVALAAAPPTSRIAWAYEARGPPRA